MSYNYVGPYSPDWYEQNQGGQQSQGSNFNWQALVSGILGAGTSFFNNYGGPSQPPPPPQPSGSNMLIWLIVAAVVIVLVAILLRK